MSSFRLKICSSRSASISSLRQSVLCEKERSCPTAPSVASMFGAGAEQFGDDSSSVGGPTRASNDEAAAAASAGSDAAASDRGTLDDDGFDEDGAGVVRTNKKSEYMTEEVEEKLGLAGADPYGLLELEDRRWKV